MPPSKQDNFSLKEFLLYYLRYWPWFVASILLSLVGAYIYLRYAKPVYNANALLQIKNNSENSGAGEEFEKMFFFRKSDNLADEIEILKSRNMTGRVAQAMGLQDQYYAIGNVKTTLIYPYSPIRLQILKKTDSLQPLSFKLTPVSDSSFSINEATDKIYGFGKSFMVGNDLVQVNRISNLPNTDKLQNQEYLVVWQPVQSALWMVKGGLAISKVKDESNLLYLSYNGIHPELGKDILKTLVNEYQEVNVEDKNRIASRTNDFINERLRIISNELGDVEKDLQDFRQTNNVINIEQQSSDLIAEMTALDKQIIDLDVKLKVIEYLQEYLKDKSNYYQVVPTSLGIGEEILGQLVDEYNTVQLKREADIKNTTPQNPIIQVADQQLEKIRANLNENLRTIYLSTILTRDNLKRKSNSFRENLGTVPRKEKKLLEIKRQQGIKEALYLFLLQKREETNISLASTVSNSKLVDFPVTSSIPVKPDRKNIYTIAFFIGLLIPTLVVYLIEILDDRISTRRDLEKVLTMPIIGEIGHAESTAVLQVRTNSKNYISEQFRMLRSNLQYLLNNVKETPVIMTTSTFSGEGKSFVSINLGAALALSGKKTVILEFDLRKPKILHSLGIKRAEGFTNYLVGGAPIQSIPIAVPEVENLYVVGCGAIPPNPSEMLGDEKVADAFRYFLREFDAIVMDTAPIGLVSDAQLLSHYSNCTLYVVRSKYTYKKQLNFVENLFKEDKLPKMSVVVNDIDQKKSQYSYGSYHYGYGYGYGDGYFDYSKSSRWGWLRRLRKDKSAKS